MTHHYKGKFVILDGLDGSGKGTCIEGLKEKLTDEGKKVFDLCRYWKDNKKDMDFNELKQYDVVITEEPTHIGIGKVIRDEMIADNGRKYSARATAQAYALDRLVLYSKVILPLLNEGRTIIQSRSVSSSLTYQKLQSEEQGEPLTLNEIVSMGGNIFALDNAPDLLIILSVRDVEKIIPRLKERDKKDNSIFEKLEFQKKLKGYYESEWFREIFEKRGTKLEYVYTDKSIEDSKEQVLKVYNNFMNNN
ncbi:deoxynucleoside kinase [Candidatus Woesearchaeota archaeon]|nr:deoxynucleoside kinase [Candidatus Woesearchaeota archaeon]